MEGAPASLVLGEASSDPSLPDGVPVAAIPRLQQPNAPQRARLVEGTGKLRVFSRSMVSKSCTSECPPLQEVQEAARSLRLSSDCPFCYCVRPQYLADKTAWSWQRGNLQSAREARSTRPAHVACNTGDLDNPPSKHSGNNGGGWYF